jgi:hypothetical protein
MRIHINIDFAYSLKEIFSLKAHRRANELRTEAEKIYGKDGSPRFVCKPHPCLDNKSPLELSVSSPKNHDRVMMYLKYGGSSYI